MRDLKKLDLIDQLSVPLFAATMLWEYQVLKNKPRRVEGDLDTADFDTLAGEGDPPDPLIPVGYERRDTEASLAMLVGSVAAGVAFAPLEARWERFLYRHRIANFGTHRSAAWSAAVLWDFLYYWEHRWMHEVRLLWAHHVTHHSSERYNLSTALRQPVSPWTVFWVFAPFGLLGYTSKQKHRAGQINLLYQYWIHTEAIDRCPPVVEAVFNTPSHHRAHHGANPQYLDTNYGGILIIWDKLFGSFEPEKRRIKYGLTKNIKTFNPIRIGFHEMVDIARDVRNARSWRDRFKYVFGPPGWRPAER